MAHIDYQHLARRTAFVKTLREKAFNIENNKKCGAYQRGFSSIVYNIFLTKQ